MGCAIAKLYITEGVSLVFKELGIAFLSLYEIGILVHKVFQSGVDSCLIQHLFFKVWCLETQLVYERFPRLFILIFLFGFLIPICVLSSGHFAASVSTSFTTLLGASLDNLSVGVLRSDICLVHQSKTAWSRRPPP